MPDFAPLSTTRRWALGSGDKPPATLGRFELKKQSGRGAQATVWLAVDPRLQREVAIKLMRPLQDQDPSVLEQWLREARHVGRLAHPYIVPVFEADVHGLQPYIVFEYVPGRTLAEHLAQQGRCSPHDAVALMVEVLDGLQAAHQAGVAHGDLQLDSIVIDTQWHALVMGLGVAAFFRATSETTDGGRRAAAAPSMDVYSAALVLLGLLTGQPARAPKNAVQAQQGDADEGMVVPPKPGPGGGRRAAHDFATRPGARRRAALSLGRCFAGCVACLGGAGQCTHGRQQCHARIFAAPHAAQK